MSEITNEQVAAAIGACQHPTDMLSLHPNGDLVCIECGDWAPEGGAFPATDYLHDLAAAGLVLERLRERYYIQLRVVGQGQWRVTCDELPLRPGAGFADEWADTLPEAICRAALALARVIGCASLSGPKARKRSGR